MNDTQHSFRDYSIIVDTDEKKGWKFLKLREDASAGKNADREIILSLVEKNLRCGDYTIDGHENEIAIERKSKDDFFKCLGGDRRRFKEQIRRMNEEVKRGYVIVEASFQSILNGMPDSGMNPKVAIRTRISWELRFPNVRWYFCPSVRAAEAVCFRILDRYWELYGKNLCQNNSRDQQRGGRG